MSASSFATDLSGDLVPLHVLCEVCQGFCRTWDVLDVSSESAWDILDKSSESAWNPSFMCTVAHLVQSHPDCHLCNLVWAASGRHPNVGVFERLPEANVFLHAATGKPGEIVVQVKLVQGMPDVVEEGKVVAAFLLGSYQCTLYNTPSPYFH